MVDKVGLIYTDEYQRYNFGRDHPLRPLRLKLTYSLMEKLKLLEHQRLTIIQPRIATQQEIESTHSPEYIKVVKKLSENPKDNSVIPYRYGLGPGDNPIFKGMYEASALICGASIKAVETVWNEEEFKIAFNPAGGLHHAMKDKASGFCIFNDIGVAINHLKTLKKDIKIAYLDIDCHHGDGVQWLFYDDPNVLTISYHQDGRFLFPGTGNINENGEGKGKGFSINFPLLPGTHNKPFLNLFRKTAPKLLEAYAPDILITQLGVDTYFDDPLTQMGFSLSIYRDIAQTLKTAAREYCQNKWVALGGGGYLMTVVPRAWTIFLSKMLDIELENELPDSWIKEAKEIAQYEDPPYLLWDRGEKVQVQMLSHPEITKKIIDYTKSLIEISDEKYIPNLGKG
ncbi:MAG: acetoin utilization protein AcuC [Promethearchaeota archaeon Loki_b32]|nr:MAG: acetoin utilization protein AcuC [Candidatus Lokiarchaeota archaeon Loki_b32]